MTYFFPLYCFILIPNLTYLIDSLLLLTPSKIYLSEVLEVRCRNVLTTYEPQHRLNGIHGFKLSGG